MIRAGLHALLSHWARHPLQLAMLLLGLALATALWSGVQAINAEARAAYARAAASLGQDQLDRIVARDAPTFRQDRYIALRRAGWTVSPLLEGRLKAANLRILGIDPLTLPVEAATQTATTASGAAAGPGSADLAGFVQGNRARAHPETIAWLAAQAGLAQQAGLADLGFDAAPGLPPMTLVVDIGLAQRLLGQPDQLTALIVAPGPQPDTALPAGLDRRKPAPDTGLARLTDSFHLNLTAFGFLAFAVGIFIVHSAIGLAFEQRRPVFRTLRALGLPARSLTLLIVGELLVLSLVAGAVGVALGYLVAALLLPDVAATLGGLYGAPVPGTLQLRAEWWATGMAIAVVGTLAAAGQSLWTVSRLPVLAQAKPRAWALASARTGRWQTGAGVALLAAAAGLLAFGSGLGSGLGAGFGGLAALMLGAALMLPPLLALVVGQAARRSHGVVAQWFWADTGQQLPGLSLALMALLLALATNVGVGTMVASFRATFTGWLDQRLVSELYLTTRTEAEAAAVTAWLGPRVDAILPILSAATPLIGQPAEVYGIADHPTYRDHWPLLTALPDVWDQVAAGRGVLVNEQLARRSGLGTGSPLPLPGGALPVVGIYSDYGNPAPQAILGLATFNARFPGLVPLRFGLRLPPERTGVLAADLRARFDLPDTALVDQAAIKAFSLGIFERTFTITTALNLLTLGVATLAIFASLMTLASLRLPQLAPIWAMGLTLRRLALLDLARTIVLAVLTAVAALPLGLALAWVLLAVVNVQAFGWRLPLQVFPADWGILAAAALAAATLAAVIPTWRLARRPPADLIRVFTNER